MGKFVDLSMFVPIINGKSEGKAKLYHSNNPFFADLMISFGKIIIKTLKYIAKIEIKSISPKNYFINFSMEYSN